MQIHDGNYGKEAVTSIIVFLLLRTVKYLIALCLILKIDVGYLGLRTS